METKEYILKTLNELEQILLSDEAIKQTAKQFQPAIELVYHDAFNEAL